MLFSYCVKWNKLIDWLIDWYINFIHTYHLWDYQSTFQHCRHSGYFLLQHYPNLAMLDFYPFSYWKMTLLIQLRCQIFFHCLLHGGDGILIRSEPGHGLSVLIHNELCEVPLDCVDQKTRLFFLEKHPQGVSLGPIDVNFGKQIKLEKSYNADDIGM